MFTRCLEQVGGPSAVSPSCLSRLAPPKGESLGGPGRDPWASRQRSHLPSSPWWRKNLLPQVQRSAAWRGPPLPSPGLCAQRAFCCLVLFLGNHEDCSRGLSGAPEPVLAPGQGVNQNQSRTLKTPRSLCRPRAGTLSLLKTTFPDSSLSLFSPPHGSPSPGKAWNPGDISLSLVLPAEAREAIDAENERWAPGRGRIEQFIFIHPSIYSFIQPTSINLASWGATPEARTLSPHPQVAMEGVDKVCGHNHRDPSNPSVSHPKLPACAPFYNSAPLGRPGGFSIGSATMPVDCDPRGQGRWASRKTSRTVARNVLLTKQ